jgi:hypothetical protein
MGVPVGCSNYFTASDKKHKLFSFPFLGKMTDERWGAVGHFFCNKQKASFSKDTRLPEVINRMHKKRQGHRVYLFMGFIFPDLALRLKPVSTCLAVLAAPLFVQFIGPCGDLRCHIDRYLGQ